MATVRPGTIQCDMAHPYLRRATASWRKRDGLDHCEKKLVDGRLARGHDRAFAPSAFSGISKGSASTASESHAVSFALLVYASVWLKRHETRVSTAGC